MFSQELNTLPEIPMGRKMSFILSEYIDVYKRFKFLCNPLDSWIGNFSIYANIYTMLYTSDIYEWHDDIWI